MAIDAAEVCHGPGWAAPQRFAAVGIATYARLSGSGLEEDAGRNAKIKKSV